MKLGLRVALVTVAFLMGLALCATLRVSSGSGPRATERGQPSYHASYDATPEPTVTATQTSAPTDAPLATATKTPTLGSTRPTVYLPLLVRPPLTLTIAVESGAKLVTRRAVTLKLGLAYASEADVQVQFSNDGQDWSEWEAYRSIRPDWLLTETNGPKTVWVRGQVQGGPSGTPGSATAYFLLNADFEGDLEVWAPGGEMGSTLIDAPERTTRAAVLGNPAHDSRGVVPKGNAHVSQALFVPADGKLRLAIEYRVYSHDAIWSASGSRFIDTFEVYVTEHPISEAEWTAYNQPSAAGTDFERRLLLCGRTDSTNHPAGTPDTTEYGLVLCDGNAGTATGLSAPWDSGWRTATLDFSPYAGQTVYLTLANFSRWDTWYNTYTYIDAVTLP